MNLLLGFLLLVATPAPQAPASDERRCAERVARDPRDTDALYCLAVHQAQLGNVTDARQTLDRLIAVDSRRADAFFEMAAGYLIQEDYASALQWTLSGLRRAPEDPFGLDLAGTIHFVSGAKSEALRYWNHLGRPHLGEMRITTQGGVDRQVVADAIDFSPGDLVSWREIQKARWRLSRHRYIQAITFDPVPGETEDTYGLDVSVRGRQGPGAPAEVLLEAATGLSSRSLRVTFWNMRHTGVTATARWRWPSNARLLHVELEIPRVMHRSVYASTSISHRNEAWVFAPATGFALQRTDATLMFAIPLHLPALSMNAGVGVRRRSLHVLAPDRSRVPQSPEHVVWLHATPELAGQDRRLAGGWMVRPVVWVSLDGGRTSARTTFARLSASSDVRVHKGSPGQRRQDLQVSVHVGASSRETLAEDHFTLGTGTDFSAPLRAHPTLRGGALGSAPLVPRFALLNVTAGSDITTWKGLAVGVVTFADLGHTPAAYTGQRLRTHVMDAGVGLELGIARQRLPRLTLVWGRDWVEKRSVFYVSGSLR